MSFTYAIGDIHGRFDLLLNALGLIERDAQERGSETNRLIVLGDFVDRGPASRSVLECLKDGAPGRGWEWIVLQGNHEAMMLWTLGNPTPELMRNWIRNGGGQTILSYGYRQGDPIQPLKVPLDHLRWLEGLPVWFEDQHRIYVHAGVPADQLPGDASAETLQWMLYPSFGDDGASRMSDDTPHCSGKHIVHGHEQSEFHPLLLKHRTNMDSHACKSGRLAIGVFDDDIAGGPVALLMATGEPA